MIDRLRTVMLRGRLAAADRIAALLAHPPRGQVTIEWIALMVGFTALVTVLAGSDVWQEAGRAIVQAVEFILHKTESQERV